MRQTQEEIMRPTIRDIASLAKVSIGTVSRALKKQPGLTEQTRLHVQKIAAQLGYNESNLRQGRIRRLTFLQHRQHNNFVASPFFFASVARRGSRLPRAQHRANRAVDRTRRQRDGTDTPA
jgi:DNA-binding LacI/PurR family transcriptional regulator